MAGGENKIAVSFFVPCSLREHDRVYIKFLISCRREVLDSIMDGMQGVLIFSSPPRAEGSIKMRVHRRECFLRLPRARRAWASGWADTAGNDVVLFKATERGQVGVVVDRRRRNLRCKRLFLNRSESGT